MKPAVRVSLSVMTAILLTIAFALAMAYVSILKDCERTGRPACSNRLQDAGVNGSRNASVWMERIIKNCRNASRLTSPMSISNNSRNASLKSDVISNNSRNGRSLKSDVISNSSRKPSITSQMVGNRSRESGERAELGARLARLVPDVTMATRTGHVPNTTCSPCSPPRIHSMESCQNRAIPRFCTFALLCAAILGFIVIDDVARNSTKKRTPLDAAWAEKTERIAIMEHVHVHVPALSTLSNRRTPLSV